VENLLYYAWFVFLLMTLVANIHMTLRLWGRMAMWGLRKLIPLVASSEASGEK
jgi:hypothetical protein